MNTRDKCKNCGGDFGIHHYKTNQCPVGGREAPYPRVTEYKDTVFELDTTEIDELIEAAKDVIADAESSSLHEETNNDVLVDWSSIRKLREALAKVKSK